jgi:hypothetical protein
MEFKIHRLCRDNDTIRRLKKREKEYNLPQTEYVTGIDLFTFINNIIDSCTDDYALIVHDDVILPMNISDNVEECIKSANDSLGKDNWGVIGNAGVEVFTKKVLLYLADPNIKMIVPRTERPQLVESVDGNTMLLNLRNLRKKVVRLPQKLSGFHLYDLILSLESQRKNLVCAVSSLLYTKHLSGGSREKFKENVTKEVFQTYFSETYANEVITSINGDIPIQEQAKDNNSKSIEDIVQDNVFQLYKNESFKLYLIVEFDKDSKRIFNLLDSIKTFKQLMPEKIDIRTGFVVHKNTKPEKSVIKKIKEQYPSIGIFNINIDNRRNYFGQLSTSIPSGENIYVSIIDDNYTVESDLALYLQYLLSSSDMIISNSNGEKNDAVDKELLSGNFYNCPNLGSNMIFNSTLLEEIAEKNILVPKGLENYILYLYFAKDINPKIAKDSFYKITDNIFADDDKFSYENTTVMAQLVNEGIVPTNYFNFFQEREDYWHNITDQLYSEFISFKQSSIWKIINKFRGIREKRRIVNQ